MKRPACLFLILVLAPLIGLGQDASGRYAATLDMGPGNRQALLLILNVDGSSVAGSVGPDDQHRLYFSGGTIQKHTLTFHAGGIDMSLSIDGEKLDGFATPHGTSQKWGFHATRAGSLLLQDLYPPLSNEDAPVHSQDILALRDALAHKTPNTELAFWQHVEQNGSPLVEAVPSQADKALVTFLWHGSGATRNVMLIRGRFTRFVPHQNLFAHIEGTNVWFKSVVLPSATRFQYAISENDPAATFPQGPGTRVEQHDPLNRDHLLGSGWHSVLELPAAEPQPWYVKHPEGPKYQEKDVSLHSDVLGEDRNLKVYTPPGYGTTTKHYPVLYLFDGEDEDGLVFASWTVENLLASHAIPPIVIVRIVNPSPASREKELGCDPTFAEFLSKELAPFIRAHYDVSSTADLTGVGGYSRGGLAAAYAAMRHPETFGLVLVQSGAFWWEPNERADPYVEPNWVAKQYVLHSHMPVKFYLEAGLFEIDLQGSGGDILETTRALRDVLRAKGYEVTYHEFAGDHDYINWRGTFADGLIALFSTSQKAQKGSLQ